MTRYVDDQKAFWFSVKTGSVGFVAHSLEELKIGFKEVHEQCGIPVIGSCPVIAKVAQRISAITGIAELEPFVFLFIQIYNTLYFIPFYLFQDIKINE